MLEIDRLIHVVELDRKDLIERSKIKFLYDVQPVLRKISRNLDGITSDSDEGIALNYFFTQTLGNWRGSVLTLAVFPKDGRVNYELKEVDSRSRRESGILLVQRMDVYEEPPIHRYLMCERSLEHYNLELPPFVPSRVRDDDHWESLDWVKRD